MRSPRAPKVLSASVHIISVTRVKQDQLLYLHIMFVKWSPNYREKFKLHFLPADDNNLQMMHLFPVKIAQLNLLIKDIGGQSPAFTPC